VSSTAVNPTLTIIANSPRVADRIAGRLGISAGSVVATSPGIPEPRESSTAGVVPAA
jgi:choline dehydrogenase-like flavoprotein